MKVFPLVFVFLAACLLPAHAKDEIPSYSYEIVRQYNHNPEHFTQGLYYEDGLLYEGTGLYNQSRLVKATLSGKILSARKLPASVFGEGLTVMGDRIFQLTWKSGLGMVWDRESLKLLRLFRYSGQGWGLTHNGRSLIMSDGSATLFFLDPDDFRLQKKIEAKAGEIPIQRLNELEWIRGKIWANIWKDDRIAIIDPETGEVEAWLDLTMLVARVAPEDRDDVLNGIAYDRKNDLVLVTGKRWPSLFALKVERE